MIASSVHGAMATVGGQGGPLDTSGYLLTSLATTKVMYCNIAILASYILDNTDTRIIYDYTDRLLHVPLTIYSCSACILVIYN